MPLDVTIRDTVIRYINDDKMFTSVDIANSIKKTGIWVRTVEVRDWLKRNFDSDSLFDNYTTSQITVCNGSTMATLYSPAWLDPNDYNDRDQQPLTPPEVKDIQNKLKNKPRHDTTPDIEDILDSTHENDEDQDEGEEDSEGHIIRSVKRIKIPGALIKKLGWNPGDVIDPALIKTDLVISSKLIVNQDYRVSIPRNSVGWGTNPVRVKLKDNRIVFEKA